MLCNQYPHPPRSGLSLCSTVYIAILLPSSISPPRVLLHHPLLMTLSIHLFIHTVLRKLWMGRLFLVLRLIAHKHPSSSQITEHHRHASSHTRAYSFLAPSLPIVVAIKPHHPSSLIVPTAYSLFFLPRLCMRRAPPCAPSPLRSLSTGG